MSDAMMQPLTHDEAASEISSPVTRAEMCQVLWNAWSERWSGQRVLILGLGLSGLSMASWMHRLGAVVTVVDSRSNPPSLQALRNACPDIQIISDAWTADLVTAAQPQIILRSPGLSPATLQPLLLAAEEQGIPVQGELDVFAQALECGRLKGYVPKVLAITGTNGKTTVTSLTAKLLEHAGLEVAVAGNIGPALLDTLSAACVARPETVDGSERLPEVWVLELSSFQLDGVDGFEPTAATVLNITQDHLDWHGGMDAYAHAKSRIFGTQGVMVMNRDDPQVMALQPPSPRVSQEGGRKRGNRLAPERSRVTFGLDLPEHAGDWGLEMTAGMPWLVHALVEEEVQSRRKVQEAAPLHVQKLMPADALRIRGRHNAANALAALALATVASEQLAPMLFGLREYRGEPHRVEPIGMLKGIEFIDDSKGTNVGATAAALKGLGADRKVVVILGGDGKGQDFSPLYEPVQQCVRAVLLIGKDADLIEAALEGTGVPCEKVPDMQVAVAQAFARAKSGDAVLLSPACASLDMYRNYEHRAQVFVDAVRDLAEEQGCFLEGGT